MRGRASLLRASLWHHRRLSAGVAAGVALAAAVLGGALIVGDSVRGTLRHHALTRLGGAHEALIAGDRFPRAALAEALAARCQRPAAALLQAQGFASRGEDRIPELRILGVDARFWELHGAPDPALGESELALNARAARELGASVGDELLLRVRKPSLLPRDVPFVGTEDRDATLRLTLCAILDDEGIGRFGLEPNQLPPLNAFLPRARVAEALGRPGTANLILLGPPEPTGEALEDALRELWEPGDVGLELRPLAGGVELRSERVFLDASVAEAADRLAPAPQRILTSFVNSIALGERATPYSMVVAADPATLGALGAPALGEDEVAVSAWLAEDLGCAIGDSLTLRYFVITGSRRLIEREARLTVAAVLPDAALGAELAPDFPGLSDKESCREWDAGLPVDLGRIRPKDERYWEQRKGAPKAAIALSAGQRLWSNPYGELTALRLPGLSPEELARRLPRELAPANVGLACAPVRAQALEAARGATDFGGLFIGLSVVLIAAALVLVALLFGFGVEGRAEELGLLLAVGYRPGQVRAQLLLEGAVIALVGITAGLPVAVAYAWAVLAGLGSIWSAAVASASLRLELSAVTLGIAALASLVCALGAMAIALRSQLRRSPRALLLGGQELALTQAEAREGPLRAAIFGFGPWLCGIGALLLADASVGARDPMGGFFGAGGLLLLAGLGLARGALRGGGALRDLADLGRRGGQRRPGRSLAAVALLATGVFLVVAVGANRRQASRGADDPASGTGGFDLIGEASIPILGSFSEPDDLFAMNLEAEDVAGCDIVPLKLRPGDDASCLNLNRVRIPPILGVEPAAFAARGRFPVASVDAAWGQPASWESLATPYEDGAIPAYADNNTILWALGRSLGDTIELQGDDGQPVKLRLAGALGGTILQGRLLIDAARFREAFASVEGQALILIDAPEDRVPEVAAALEGGLADRGFVARSAVERLAALMAVENTYLSIFLALGALAMVIGSLGMGVIVLRNVLERRGELALLRAVGYSRAQLERLILDEHLSLVLLGLGAGLAAALLATVPATLLSSEGGAWLPALIAAAATAASAVLWVVLASQAALQGELLSGLRDE